MYAPSPDEKKSFRYEKKFFLAVRFRRFFLLSAERECDEDFCSVTIRMMDPSLAPSQPTAGSLVATTEEPLLVENKVRPA